MAARRLRRRRTCGPRRDASEAQARRRAPQTRCKARFHVHVLNTQHNWRAGFDRRGACDARGGLTIVWRFGNGEGVGVPARKFVVPLRKNPRLFVQLEIAFGVCFRVASGEAKKNTGKHLGKNALPFRWSQLSLRPNSCRLSLEPLPRNHA